MFLAHALRITLSVLVFAFCGTVALSAEYVVQKGNNLSWIAAQHGVAREAMIMANEAYLQEKYDRICSKRSPEFRNRTENKGALKGGLHFCNDRFYRAFANTLVPGMTLAIPEATAPVSIEQTVSAIKGNKVALVIDDTGSMSNKRLQIANYYLAALHGQQKIQAVYLYADGKVRRVEAAGVRDIGSVLVTSGDFENTYQALQEAAKENPDAIILLTDESGDDWPRHLNEMRSLPTVVAHCLPLDNGIIDCRKTLTDLVRIVGKNSMYVEGLDALTARR